MSEMDRQAYRNHIQTIYTPYKNLIATVDWSYTGHGPVPTGFGRGSENTMGKKVNVRKPLLHIWKLPLSRRRPESHLLLFEYLESQWSPDIPGLGDVPHREIG
jgi:hypothetical protein